MIKIVIAHIGIAVFFGAMLMMSGCPPMECDGGEIRLNQHQMPQLAAPVQTAPEAGAEFSNFPRDLTLEWESVDEAGTYEIEVDCFHCCEMNEWCYDVGGSAYEVFADIDATEYSFSWVGAQPGRWRVRAVRHNGQEGEWSEWREFNYTV